MFTDPMRLTKRSSAKDGVELEGKMFDPVPPFIRLSRLGDQFQIGNVLADGPTELVAKRQTSKRATVALPIFGPRFEPNVLRKEEPT